MELWLAKNLRDYAPEVGLGPGLDIMLTRSLFLGCAVRGLLLAFRNAPARPEGSEAVPSEFGTAVWPLVGFLSLGYVWEI